MSVDEEYHAHKRREKALYVLAFDQFEKKLMLYERRSLGSAAVLDVEDPRSHSTRRVSLGVLTDTLNASKDYFFKASRISSSSTSVRVGTGASPLAGDGARLIWFTIFTNAKTHAAMMKNSMTWLTNKP